jgi:hypothetical protein
LLKIPAGYKGRVPHIDIEGWTASTRTALLPRHAVYLNSTGCQDQLPAGSRLGIAAIENHKHCALEYEKKEAKTVHPVARQD